MTNKTQTANDSMMETAVNGAAAGHDLTGFEPVIDGDGYQATCRSCGRTVWVGDNGLIYSLLADSCPGITTL